MSDTTISIIIVVVVLLVVGGSFYYSVWDLKVKEDFRFMTRDQFRAKHPLVYGALLRKNKTAVLDVKANKLYLICPVCKKNPVAPDRDGICVDCSH